MDSVLSRTIFVSNHYFNLDIWYFFLYALAMKYSKSVKGLISQLISKFGSARAVAEELRISKRYVEMLRDGKKKASWALAELIRLKVNG